MKSASILSVLLLLPVGASCVDATREAERNLDILSQKARALDSLITVESRKLSQLDSILVREVGKTDVLDSIISSESTRIDSLVNEVYDRIERQKKR